MTLIKTEELTKIYQNGEIELIVLHEINLEICHGEMIALTGQSGAGKTTLMHLLGCLDNPTSGNYFLNGQHVSYLPLADLAFIRNKQIGFVFQDFHLLDDLNALENVMLPLLYGGFRESDARYKAEDALELVGLKERKNNYPCQVSGGQKQRIAIARSLIQEPSLLLADEPTGNLDTESSKHILDLFYTINHLKKTTVIIVTHEMEIANSLKRCITLRNGKIISDAIRG